MNELKTPEKNVEPALVCSHCKEPISNIVRNKEGLSFCCSGCKMVSEILKENGLLNFYNIDAKAGVSQKNYENIEYFFLDDTTTVQNITSFYSDQLAILDVELPQIHCSSCLWLLENLAKINEGIISARVNFLEKSAIIRFNPKKISLRSVAELLKAVGYAPTFRQNQEKGNVEKNNPLIKKIGLAGFVFGNIMLFSFPEYLGISNIDSEPLIKVFNYLNILLILPALVYSGSPFFLSAFQGLKAKVINLDVPISIGILVLFFRSLYEILVLNHSGFLDSLAGLLFFLLIGRWFQKVTFHKMTFDRDFTSFFPLAAYVKNGKNVVQIPVKQIEKRNLIRVRHGELIPVDGVLKQGIGEIDYSFVTGESEPERVNEGQLVNAGGKQLGSNIWVEASGPVNENYLTQLWNDDVFAKDGMENGFISLNEWIAKRFSIGILIIAFLTFIYWSFIDVSAAVIHTTSVLIVACPCAIALSIPFIYGSFIRILHSAGIHLKSIHVLERLNNIKNVVFDKTGTLTKVVGMNSDGIDLTSQDKQYLFSLASHSVHPVSQFLVETFKGEKKLVVEDFKEYIGKGISGFIDGDFLQIGSPKWFGLTSSSKYYDSRVVVFKNGKIVIGFNWGSTMRGEAEEVMIDLKKHYHLSLLSGDVQRLIPFFDRHFSTKGNLHFGKSPQEKLDFIKKITKSSGHTVMIGDGLNDSGALKAASVGVVIQATSAHFVPASDVILEESSFSKIPKLFKVAKISKNLVLGAYVIALFYNLIGLGYATLGLLTPLVAAILMPLSSFTIVLYGTISTFLASRYLRI